MLLDTLNALNLAGVETLQSTCGLSVADKEISLVREGRQNFPSLVTLRLKGCALQMVHVGCDELLTEKINGISVDTDAASPLDCLAENFLSHLVDKFDDRNPRGVVESLQESPATLRTRGVRTFQFRLDTGQGQLFLLAEIPSRTELAIAKGSEFLASMESIYLTRDWHTSQELTEAEDVDNFLSFVRKTEGDIYLETPAGDGTATLNSGLLIEVCQFDGRPALKLITDYLDPAQGIPAPGSAVEASVGIGDRSLEFVLKYLASATHELAADVHLPCALFSVPGAVSIGQRRQTFRVPVSAPVPVEIEAVCDGAESSPWSDRDVDPEVIRGRLLDLSFSGARILADHCRSCTDLHRDSRVVCRLGFPDMEGHLQVTGVIRRLVVGQTETDQRPAEIGLEFLVSAGEDRSGLDFIRQFVLEVQRTHLAQRLQVTNH